MKASRPTQKSYGKAKKRTKEQKQDAMNMFWSLLSQDHLVKEDRWLCFTDGSCTPNPGPGGSACAIYLATPHTSFSEQKDSWSLPLLHTATQSFKTATNNIAELTAISLALDYVLSAHTTSALPKVVQIFTDSVYSHGMVSKGWNPSANVELVQNIRDKIQQIAQQKQTAVHFHWVAGHANVEPNEFVDILANKARTEQK